MNKLNAFRFISLKYNKNSMRIHDEIFELGGESTLMSLRNGGGKTVMVQMLMSPFLFGKYRDLKDRKFDTYFTTNEPTYILTEWLLDNNAGYVLVGSAIRKKSASSDEVGSDEVEVVNFIHEYKSANDYDIHRIPLVDKTEKGIRIKSFTEMKNLFDVIQRENRYTFNYWPIYNSDQKKKYTSKLQEYGINHKEWQSIIRKINQKESGLSELFNEAKTIPLLIKDWFLPAVDEKLNDSENHILYFQEILKKFVYQLEENKNKIALKEGIAQFKEYANTIERYANSLKDLMKEKEQLSNTIANYYDFLEKKMKNLEEERETAEETKQGLEKEKEQITYEKLSYEYNGLLENQEKVTAIKKDIVKVLEELKEEKDMIIHSINVYECSSLYKEYIDLSKEVLELENKLDNVEKDDAKKAEEIKDIGFTLHSYYRDQLEKDKSLLKEKVREVKELEEGIGQAKRENKIIHDQQIELEKSITKTEEAIAQYHKSVEVYCQRDPRFQAETNIMGEYEFTYFSHYQREQKTLMEKLEKELTDITQRIEDNRRVSKSKHEKIHEISLKLVNIKNQKNQLKEEKMKMEESCHKLKSILKYCNLPEEKMFDKGTILNRLTTTIEHLEEEFHQLKVTLDEVKRRKEAYTSGQNIDIPKEFLKQLEDLGLQVLYGLKWMKSQDIPLAEKKEILMRNPFIPYSIMMEKSKIEILKQQNIEYFLSFPLPIVELDSLNEKKEVVVSNQIYEVNSINFYISFNDNLLDEKVMRELIEGLNKKINRIQEEITRKQEEIDIYQFKKMEAANLQLSKNDLILITDKIINTEEEIESLDGEKRRTEEEGEVLEKETVKLEGIKGDHSSKINNLLQQIKEFDHFYVLYDDFIKSLSLASEERDRLQKVRRKKGEMELAIEDQSKALDSLKEIIHSLKTHIERLEEETSKYIRYREGNILPMDFTDLTSKYESLSKELGLTVKEYKEQLNRVANNFKNKEDQLLEKADETQVTEEEYKNMAYDKIAYKSLKESLKDVIGKITCKEDEIKDTDLTLKGIEKELSYKIREIKRSGEQEPLSIDKITNTDFSGRWKVVLEKAIDIQSIISNLEKTLDTVKTTKDRMQEYADIEIFEKIEMDVHHKELESKRIHWVHLFKKNIEETADISKDLERYLNSFSSGFEYSKVEFFKHTIVSLSDHREKPMEILKILETVGEIHERTLLQLESDLSKIEEEREIILNTLLDYTKNIYANIDMIDVNSSCKINERYYKMLTIQQPDWNDELFKLKMKDYVKSIVSKSSDLLSIGQSIDDFVSNEITTKNLYDQIVGINKIYIKLYKIQETRVESITWNEVAENSGGEGFVSAFVVLISLLSYMGKDESIFFGNNEEGKVLIMDNPFAQTSSEHLLKPLMSIAKKYNTQLICFSGLGGDSIYNRFDNIYVLTTYESKLNPGAQIIESEHAKGAELVEVTSNRFLTSYVQPTLF
ncbi:coiled-coil domain-containing protein [Alkaliphilus transvaalensis]|uniref:hypothetical protein n=1 Tax=Alkaliphilus transvaalensis TaxID=114628 RepID=UPI00047DF50B|nr:hypothetical protein [Alkaliphilus transvaalensis]